MTEDVGAPTRGGLVARILIALVRCYQLIPRLGPPRCRFYPSCSAYAVDALRFHGALGGSALIVWRLARCHPFHPGGVEYVPVPSREAGSAERATETNSRAGRELTADAQPAGRS